MSIVEANNIKAKTKLINHSNVKEWIRTIFSVLFGAIIILIGLVKFLWNDQNYYYIALMMVGVFILALSKPKLEDLTKLLQN